MNKEIKSQIARYVPYNTTIKCERTGDELILSYKNIDMCSSLVLKLRPVSDLDNVELPYLGKLLIDKVSASEKEPKRLSDIVEDLIPTDSITEYLLKEKFDVFNLKQKGYAYY